MTGKSRGKVLPVTSKPELGPAELARDPTEHALDSARLPHVAAFGIWLLKVEKHQEIGA